MAHNLNTSSPVIVLESIWHYFANPKSEKKKKKQRDTVSCLIIISYHFIHLKGTWNWKSYSVFILLFLLGIERREPIDIVLHYHGAPCLIYMYVIYIWIHMKKGITSFLLSSLFF